MKKFIWTHWVHTDVDNGGSKAQKDVVHFLQQTDWKEVVAIADKGKIFRLVSEISEYILSNFLY